MKKREEKNAETNPQRSESQKELENGYEQRATQKRNDENHTEKSCKIKFNQRGALNACIANAVLALLSIGFGIAASLSSRELSYWVTKIAVGIWFGLLIAINASVGIIAVRRPTSRRTARVFAYMTLGMFCLSIIICCFYALALDFYKKQIISDQAVRCTIQGYYTKVNNTQIDEKCAELYRDKAACITAFIAALFIVCFAEVVTSSLLLIIMRKYWRCCFDLCSVDSSGAGDMSLYSVYHGSCSYGPTFGQLLYVERERSFEIPKSTVVKKPEAFHVHAKHDVPCNYTRPKIVQKKTKRPPLHTMESITESCEDTENLDGGIFSYEEEQESEN